VLDHFLLLPRSMPRQYTTARITHETMRHHEEQREQNAAHNAPPLETTRPSLIQLMHALNPLHRFPWGPACLPVLQFKQSRLIFMHLRPSQRWLALAQLCVFSVLVSYGSVGDITGPCPPDAVTARASSPGAPAITGFNSPAPAPEWSRAGRSLLDIWGFEVYQQVAAGDGFARDGSGRRM
jgi:hypothetical protein